MDFLEIIDFINQHFIDISIALISMAAFIISLIALFRNRPRYKLKNLSVSSFFNGFQYYLEISFTLSNKSASSFGISSLTVICKNQTFPLHQVTAQYLGAPLRDNSNFYFSPYESAELTFQSFIGNIDITSANFPIYMVINTSLKSKRYRLSLDCNNDKNNKRGNQKKKRD